MVEVWQGRGAVGRGQRAWTLRRGMGCPGVSQPAISLGTPRGTPGGYPCPSLFDRKVMRPSDPVRVSGSMRPNRYQFEEKVIQGSDGGFLLTDRGEARSRDQRIMSLFSPRSRLGEMG